MKSYEKCERVGEDPLGRNSRNCDSAAEFAPTWCEGFGSSVASLGNLFRGGWELVLPAYDTQNLHPSYGIISRLSAHIEKAALLYPSCYPVKPGYTVEIMKERWSKAKSPSGLFRFTLGCSYPLHLLLTRENVVIGVELCGGGLNDFHHEVVHVCLILTLKDSIYHLCNQIPNMDQTMMLYTFDQYFLKIDDRWEGVSTPSRRSLFKSN